MAWAASDLVKYILHPVVVTSKTDADTTFGPDVFGLTVTAGVAPNGTGNVIDLYVGLFMSVGVIDTDPDCIYALVSMSDILQVLLYLPYLKRPSELKNRRCTVPSALFKEIPAFPSANP